MRKKNEGCFGSRYRRIFWLHRPLSGRRFVSRLFDEPTFPFATLAVNVAGCLLIGLLGGLSEKTDLLSPSAQMFLIVGFLGGFTTYSAFGYQTLTLMRDGYSSSAFLNVAAHLILGFGAVWLGALIAKQI